MNDHFHLGFGDVIISFMQKFQILKWKLEIARDISSTTPLFQHSPPVPASAQVCERMEVLVEVKQVKFPTGSIQGQTNEAGCARTA